MSSNLQSRARALLPVGSQGYEDFLQEYFPEELKARRRRAATNAEIRMAQDHAKPLLETHAAVRVMSNFHNPVVVRQDGTTKPAIEYNFISAKPKEMTPERALESAQRANGFAFAPAEENGEEKLIVLTKPEQWRKPSASPAISDCKTPMSAAAKLAAAREAGPMGESREGLSGAQGLARITGQQPLVGWDGKMFAVKAPTGQMVFYKSVKNANMVYPPGTKRITLEMQEKERLETQAKADADHWNSLPMHKKLGALISETFQSKPKSMTKHDSKAPESRHAKTVIKKHQAKAAELRDDISVKAQQAKTKLVTAKSDLEKKIEDMTTSVQKKALDIKSKAVAVKDQTFASAKNTVAQLNTRANAQIEDVASKSRKYWQNANQYLKRSLSRSSSDAGKSDELSQRHILLEI